MPGALVASDIMDLAAFYLNDTALSNYTYAAQLPALKIANERLEKLLLINGVEVQRVISSAIVVTAGVKTLTLPSDFLLPIKLFEKQISDSSDQYTLMSEMKWDPEAYDPVTNMQYWVFRNNGIYFPGCLNDTDILLEYERQLGAISGNSSVIDFYLSKQFLGAVTAELCARNIGMNKTTADDIRDNYVAKAEDDLSRVLVLNDQGTRTRRGRFTTKNTNISGMR